MKKGFLLAAAIAFAFVNLQPAFAHSRHQHSLAVWGAEDGWDGDGGFSAATLTGTYTFTASGFMNHTGPGEVTILGTLTFDGVSAVTGNLIVTAANGGQVSCANTFTAGGTYTITTSTTAPGLGTLVLPFGTGVINFDLLVPRSEGASADVIESDNGALATGLSICGITPTSMALKGHLKALPTGNWGD